MIKEKEIVVLLTVFFEKLPGIIYKPWPVDMAYM